MIVSGGIELTGVAVVAGGIVDVRLITTGGSDVDDAEDVVVVRGLNKLSTPLPMPDNRPPRDAVDDDGDAAGVVVVELGLTLVLGLMPAL